MPRTVLLVDDDLAEIALVKRALERGGYEARVATNVSDGWSELARTSSDVLLLAPECDGGEGAELARRLTGQLGARSVALVVLGAPVEGVLARVVARPIDARVLEEALEQAGLRDRDPNRGPGPGPDRSPDRDPDRDPDPCATPAGRTTPRFRPLPLSLR